MALLEIRDLKVSYGFITALKGVNIDVEQGQIVALLGSNGAGKTTTLRTISGVIKPQAGKIILDGKEVQGKSTYKVSKEGVMQSPEGRLLFPELTVEENLKVGAYGLKTKKEKVVDENGVETRTMWKVEAVQVVKTEFNFDLKVWCPYSHSWVYAHEDIDVVIHPVDIEDRPCQTFRKIEDNNWEEF